MSLGEMAPRRSFLHNLSARLLNLSDQNDVNSFGSCNQHNIPNSHRKHHRLTSLQQCPSPRFSYSVKLSCEFFLIFVMAEHVLIKSQRAKDKWDQLCKVAEIVTPEATNRSEFIAECKSGKLDHVVAAYRTFPSVSITGRFDAELVQATPKNWRFLSHNGDYHLGNRLQQ
jgi:hypothetical protein